MASGLGQQRCEPGLAARPTKSLERNHCIVDRDGPQDEVGGRRDQGGSQRDTRAVPAGGDPGSDPPTPHEDRAVIRQQLDDGPGSNADWTN